MSSLRRLGRAAGIKTDILSFPVKLKLCVVNAQNKSPVSSLGWTSPCGHFLEGLSWQFVLPRSSLCFSSAWHCKMAAGQAQPPTAPAL